ncbi:MAG: Rap1a/Tai family immunity protein [Pseudomonadota bacterium]
MTSAKQITLLLVTLIFSGTASAAFTDGNELQRWMVQDETQGGNYFQSGLFRGYIGGVVDVGDGILFCIPTGVTRGQYVAVVAKYIKAHPEKWNQDASALVVNAMTKAFPCPKN